MTTHGGARKGAGRPRVNIDLTRIKELLHQGLSRKVIAGRLDVERSTIDRAIRREVKPLVTSVFNLGGKF